MNSRDLIFIISQPRSGSTVLQSVLGSHHKVFNAGEPWVALLPSLFFGHGKWESNFNRNWAQIGMSAFFTENHISESLIQSKIGEFLLSVYSECLTNSNKSIFLDKTPRYYQILNEIRGVFPEAKIILLRRRPAMVLKSILRTWVKEDYAKLLSYKVDLIDAVQAINSFESSEPLNVLNLQFEQILRDPESSIRRICDFVEIDYEPTMLDYDRHSNRVFGDQNYLEHTHIQEQPDTGIDLSGLTSDQKSLVINYVQHLGNEKYTKFGYDYSQDMELLGKQTSISRMSDVWRAVVEFEPFTDTDQQVDVLRKHLKRRKWLKLFR